MRGFIKPIPVVALVMAAVCAFLVYRHASTSTIQVVGSLPTPVAPEPDPFSDRYPALIYLASRDELDVLYRHGIDIDHVAEAGEGVPGVLVASVYVNAGEASRLSSAGLIAIPVPNESLRAHRLYGPGSGAPIDWPTFEEYVARMQGIADDHPDLVNLISIGSSVQGRAIWCLEISDNPDLEEHEPEFKYTSTMHGDEIVGVELSLRLAELLVDSYGVDPALTVLVDGMETWFCPIHNPDGYVAGSRNNAHGINLNRDFPDRFTDPVDDPAGHEPETQAFMNFGYGHRFVMGANYHGGALVVNYPWDAVAEPGDPVIPEYAPDDQLFYDFSVGYSERNPMIWNGGFPEGVTRGWEWYQIWGGMQDWAYLWRGEHHVTIEVSSDKNPPYADMDAYWEDNREAMLWWMGRSLTGIHGLVRDARNSAPLDAIVTVEAMDSPNFARTDPDVGDYHRVTAAGSYSLTASADGYLPQSYSLAVIDDTATYRDFALCPVAGWTVSGTVTQAETGLPLEATVEFVGAPVTLTTSPEDGFYAAEICPYTYTMRASAPFHYPEERLVVIDHAQTQNFELTPTTPFPDLSASTKTTSTNQALPGEALEYQLVLQNSGITATVSMTDTLPPEVTWNGELTATQGSAAFVDGQITWQDTLAVNQPVTITYGVTLGECLPAGLEVLNLMELTDNYNGQFTRTATIRVANAAPDVPDSPTPVTGAQNVPLQVILSWSASQDLNCEELTYDVALGINEFPPLIATGLTAPALGVSSLLPATTYYWSVTVHDGLSQRSSETWSFTTASESAQIVSLYFPLIRR